MTATSWSPGVSAIAQQAESVYLGHHDIGQHEIRRIGIHSRKRDSAVTTVSTS
jgi:hypothetical protein